MKTEVEASVGANKPWRLDHVDGLRALAAIYVTVHHMVFYAFVDPPLGMGGRVLRLFLFGHYAVNVFIVVSGFCLMLPVIRNDGALAGGVLNFFGKRARRILPPYYAALTLSLVLIWLFIGTPIGNMWSTCIPVTMRDVLSHLILIQDWFSATHNKINYPLWSISVEWRIYFCFPLMVVAWHRFGAFRMAAAAVLISCVLQSAVRYTCFDALASGVNLHYYGLFALGMLAAGLGYSKESRLVLWRSRVPWAALFPVMLGMALYADNRWWHGMQLPWQYEDLLVGLGTLCLLVAVAVSETTGKFYFARKALSWPPLVFAGTFSYSLYLMHAPLLQIVWVYLARPLHLGPLNAFLFLSTVGLAAIMACAYLFYLAFERPFTGRRKSGSKVEVPASKNITELFETVAEPTGLAEK